ncbi:cilia- and flagella-associated protein 47-like isoform 2-T3 [Odontesthes bonariensis]|uniref:cilia- and flagella-associated protein 47-like n=1 Tax=Odontesthes bonariensis TaxID=219752 RepID=UPI003F580CEA
MAQSCVRVDPPSVEFKDVKVGEVYKTAVTITNVGKNTRKIRIEKPTRKLFKFITSSRDVSVASGLRICGLLEFTPVVEEEVRDYIQVHIDDVETMQIPVLGFPRACSLIMDSFLDFGCIVANSQVISKHHPITNQGSAPGVFQVEYCGGDSSLSLSPSSGVVAAGTTQWLNVELRTDRPSQIEEKVLVRLQNRSAAVLSVRAEVVEQCLEVADLKGTPLSCLWFGPVYFGTSGVEKVVLKNNAPQACDWVCFIQNNAAGSEVGADLQKSTDAALLGRMKKYSQATHDISQVFVCVPKQGQLGPYDKTTVEIRFSPICKRTSHGDTANRQDYCLFLLFDTVGSKHGFTHRDANSSVEVAVTGSGLPVSLVASPSHRFDFLSCATGQRVDLMCLLQNLCPQLPVSFRFRKMAHFTSEPSAATIAPGQCQDVVLTFSAGQQGSFRMRQKIDVIGYVVPRRDANNTEDKTELVVCSFHTITLHLFAICHSETKHPTLLANSAIRSPIVLRPHVRCSELARYSGVLRAAVLSADKTQLHKHRRLRNQNPGGEEFLALPNDRASSIRPNSSQREYRTIFTDVPRYRYVDSNYAFTEEEEELKRQHRQIYADFIQQLRQTRLQRIKERQQESVEDDVDIGIVPSHGLVPPRLHISDRERCRNSETKFNYSSGFSGTKSSRPQTSITQNNSSQTGSKDSQVMNAVPSTAQEVADCNRTLTAQELYQVDIGPSFVDFGAVCVQRVCVQTLKLVNHLSVNIWVQLEADCPELQGSSPLSYILPPCSHKSAFLTFQSYKLGPFYRSLSYSVNQKHPGQILVQAQVVPLALELSTNLLVLHPTSAMFAGSEYRNSVTLQNQCSHPVEFTWQPVVTDNGILFSVRPATGAVEPYKELDCEVVWHPSFSSQSEGDFDLCVREGITQRLHCVAKVGSTTIQLSEKRIMFSSVSLNIPSVRTAVLHNTGQDHAYFQVVDVLPLPGMVVSPSEGVVPSKGQVMLNIQFNPDSVIKFDTRVKIALRNMKSIELRVGGSVEPPNIDISVSHLQFGGLHTGSQRAIPFTLTNHSSAAAQVSFDLSEYKDFSIQLPQPSAKREQDLSVLEVQGCQTKKCSLVFSPTQVASYDFYLPLMVNGVKWPASSSLALTPSVSSTVSSPKHIKPLCYSATMAAQQSPWIQATALCAPLEMSPSQLQFHVESRSDKYTKKVELKAEPKESVCWLGVIEEDVYWWFDCSAATVPTQGRREHELFSVSPSSGSLRPGQSIFLVVAVHAEAIRTETLKVTELSIPLYLGDKGGDGTQGNVGQQPYRKLSVTITLELPSITIYPREILLTPVPLRSKIETSLTLLVMEYPSGTTVLAEVDDMEMEDGTKIQPVSVTFPEGNTVRAQDHNEEAKVTSLVCTVSFCSDVPLSMWTTITFADHMNNRFRVKLCAIADNCLLTVWPYMALHHSDQRVVLKTGATAVEAVLQCYCTPSPASGLTSSSSFDHNSSTNKNSDSFPDSDSVSEQASRDTYASPNRGLSSNLSIPKFPVANTEEGQYYQNVLLAVERWFSLFGWPSGPHPITIPHTLRRVVSKIQTNQFKGGIYGVSQNKDTRSVVDMLHHLTGKRIPGISLCQTFSSDLGQRTDQLLQQYEAMLTFLRVQGACLSHIRPEYLLDVLEFKHWCSLQLNDIKHGLDHKSFDYESLSKRSWTDVLLQIYKVLVLCRVSWKGLNTALNHKNTDELFLECTQSLASNIYSSWELKVLSWLQMHYQSMRKTVWGRDGVPPARWIVNFDMDLTDGLVLAALLAAYCPYLKSHFQRMYTTTNTLEQILHNNIIVARALTLLCLNINVQPTDLSDPNPVQMLILCVHLYEMLPQFLPSRTITLSGSLHGTFSKQVLLKNPTSKPIKYQVLVLGEDAHFFSLPNGFLVTIPPKSNSELAVQYNCLFLRPMEAVLLLISCSDFGLRCTTLAFNLRTHVSHITPANMVRCSSPCYQPKVITVPLINTLSKEANFRVVLVESTCNPLEPETRKESLVQHVQEMTSDLIIGTQVENGDDREFQSATRSVCLKSGQADSVSILYLPFFPGTKYCSVLLVCPQVGDMVYMVKATSQLPLPSPLSARSCNTVSIPKNLDSDISISMVSLHCKVGEVCEEMLQVPRINMQWEQALAVWGQNPMNTDELRRRMLTHTLHSSTVRAATAAQKFLRLPLLRSVYQSNGIEYNVEVSLPQYFTLPSTVTIPVKEDTTIQWENAADCGCVDVPLQFQADSAGQFPCEVIFRSCCDTRVYLLEALVTPQEGSTCLDSSVPALSKHTTHSTVWQQRGQEPTENLSTSDMSKTRTTPSAVNKHSNSSSFRK